MLVAALFVLVNFSLISASALSMPTDALLMLGGVLWMLHYVLPMPVDALPMPPDIQFRRHVFSISYAPIFICRSFRPAFD